MIKALNTTMRQREREIVKQEGTQTEAEMQVIFAVTIGLAMAYLDISIIAKTIIMFAILQIGIIYTYCSLGSLEERDKCIYLFELKSNRWKELFLEEDYNFHEISSNIPEEARFFAKIRKTGKKKNIILRVVTWDDKGRKKTEDLELKKEEQFREMYDNFFVEDKIS